MAHSVDLVARLGGEPITYEPHGGVPRQFMAIVERRPTQVQEGRGLAYPVNTIEVLIPRDATDGVLAILTRQDRLRFKKTLSDREETVFTVQTVQQEDAGLIAGDGGMFRVWVQA
jgi:hypothetical protein